MLQIFAIIRGTSVMNFGKNPQHDFPKMRGGSTAVWSFSENSSVFERTGFPKSTYGAIITIIIIPSLLSVCLALVFQGFGCSALLVASFASAQQVRYDDDDGDNYT